MAKNQKSYNHNPNIKPDIFNKQKITQRQSLKPKTNWNFKALFGLLISTISITHKSSRPEVFLKKRCSENMQQIYRSTSKPKCDFNKAAKELYWNHTSAGVFFRLSGVFFFRLLV